MYLIVPELEEHVLPVLDQARLSPRLLVLELREGTPRVGVCQANYTTS